MPYMISDFQKNLVRGLTYSNIRINLLFLDGDVPTTMLMIKETFELPEPIQLFFKNLKMSHSLIMKHARKTGQFLEELLKSKFVPAAFQVLTLLVIFIPDDILKNTNEKV